MRVTMKGIRVMAILGVTAVVAGLGGVQHARADGGIEPPPLSANERLSGPAVIGTITLDGAEADFTGNCRGQSVSVINLPFPVTIANVTQQAMEGFRLNNAGPAGCFKATSTGGENMLINTVTKFTKTGSAVIADVVLMFVVTQ